MNQDLIEDAAREVHTRIWRQRETLFPLGVPKPVAMLEPEVAAVALGVNFEFSEGLGTWGRDHEIAGLLDQQRNLISISRRFDHVIQRFTGAHEVGHLFLRHAGLVMHRDRPITDLHESRFDPQEREANQFAAFFLMPRALVADEFQKRFHLGPPLPLIDEVAFNLCGNSAHRLMRAGPDSLEFAAAAASAKRFNGQHFRSLADEFRVSIKAMAIRLRELDLIAD